MEKSWRIFLITSVGVFMAALDLFIVNIAFPDISRDFSGSSLSDLSWILNAYAIVFAALLVPAGRVADRIGRKRVFIAGLLVFTGASGVSAAAPSVGVLVAARVVQAAGGAMLLPSSLGLILPAFPIEKRAVAVGAWSAVAGVAAALGPPLGGLLVELSWRWIFVVNVPIGLTVALIAALQLAEVREPQRGHRPDALGALLLAAGIGLLTAGIVKGPDWGWTDARTLGAFAVAVVLVVAFFARSARHPAPVIELPLLRVRSFAFGNLATMIFFAGFGAMLLGGVLLLTEVWHYSALHAGVALAPGPLMAALVAAPAGRVSARIGPRPVAAAGGIVFGAGFLAQLAALEPTPDYAGSFLPWFMLGGVGVGLSISSLPAAVTASLPSDRFATGSAVFGMSRQLGAAIGVAVLIAILANPSPGELFDRLQDGWAFMAATGFATTLAGLAIGPPVPAPRAEAEPQAELAVAPASGR
jgi:EmrB/QacA subfamily drug resistance transporter